MDLNSLIGLEEDIAKDLLIKNGFSDIEIIINAKDEEKCNKILVCAVRQIENHITLICGKFFIIEE